MNLPPNYLLAPRRVHRKRRGAVFGPPPPVTNHIVGVSPGVAADRFVVTLSTALTSWGDVDSMLAVSVDGGTWFAAVDIDASDPLNVVLIFGAEHPDATLWTVPGGDQWHFADEQGLAPPFSGEIEA